MSAFDKYNAAVAFIAADMHYVRYIHDAVKHFNDDKSRFLTKKDLAAVRAARVTRDMLERRMYAEWGIDFTDDDRPDVDTPDEDEPPPALHPRRGAQSNARRR